MLPVWARMERRVIVVEASTANLLRVRAIVRWVRALAPAAILVVSPIEARRRAFPDDAITLDADRLPSGPLSVAHALFQAANDVHDATLCFFHGLQADQE